MALHRNPPERHRRGHRARRGWHRPNWLTVATGVHRRDKFWDQRCSVCGRTRRIWR